MLSHFYEDSGLVYVDIAYQFRGLVVNIDTRP